MKRPQKEWVRIISGALAALTLYTALSGLLSLLIVRGRIGEDCLPACMPVIACIAALIGAIAAAGSVKSALICAAVIWMALLCLGLAICGAAEPRRAALLALEILLGTAAAIRIRRGRGKAAKRRRRSRK